MEKYDYRKEITDDIINYINDNDINISHLSDEEEIEELYDELWMADSVTGNGSGSYTLSTYKAEENLCHNLFLLLDALTEFGYEDVNALEMGAEWCDVIIRCYLLRECLEDALEII